MKLFKIAYKLTSILTILASVTPAGEHIFQVLAKYSWVFPQYLRVLSQYLQVLSRWIHPMCMVRSLIMCLRACGAVQNSDKFDRVYKVEDVNVCCWPMCCEKGDEES